MRLHPEDPAMDDIYADDCMEYEDIIVTMCTGFTGARGNDRVATALVLEGKLGIRITVSALMSASSRSLSGRCRSSIKPKLRKTVHFTELCLSCGDHTTSSTG